MPAFYEKGKEIYMNIYQATALIAVAFFVAALAALAKRKLDFRYVMFWVGISLLLIIISANVNLLEKIAQALKVYYAPSLLFVAALTFLLAFIFYITIFISDTNKRVVRLTQEIGLLKEKLNELSKKEQNK